MVGKLFRCLVMAAALNVSVDAAAYTSPAASIHRAPVDASAYPWSAIGKLFNEAGGACTGAIIARDKILTAAHCVYNARTRRFAPASSLHFMVGYRGGQAAVHARVARYETGAGYDPVRWSETMDADWVILTLTEHLPQEIEPLRLSRTAAPSGTRAMIAGYPQDRAHAMTADTDCELGGGEGRLVFHTCRGMRGYSGAPILVSAFDNEVEIAGIHIAMSYGAGVSRMIAVPAQAIPREQTAAREDAEVPAASLTIEASPMLAAGEVDSGWFE